MNIDAEFKQLPSGHWYWRVCWLGRVETNTHDSLLEAITAFRQGALWVSYPDERISE